MKSFILPIVALACAVSTATAQDANPIKPQGKPVEASTPIVKSKEKVELNLPVTGLTADNAGKTKTMLEQLKAPVYNCGSCDASYSKAGECCQSPLTAEQEPILESIVPAPDKGQITIKTHPGMELRLSQVERALKANSLEIDNNKLAISGHAVLTVQTKADDASVKTLETTFTESGLFERVDAAPAEGGIVCFEVVAGPKAPTRSEVTKTLQRVDGSSKLQDVVWNSWSAPKKSKSIGSGR